MRTRIDRWGNSLGLRLPKNVADRVGLREGDQVDIDVDGSTLKIRRARPRYTLDELLAGMAPESSPEELADARTGYVPRRGDLVWIDGRPALVLTPREYNEHGLLVACAISTKEKGRRFEVPLPPGVATAGVAVADQIRSFDWRARRIEFRESAPDEIVDEVIARIGALLPM